MDLSAYTPGSVPAHRYRSRGGDHLSRTVVTNGLQQPTRRHWAGRPACCSVLLRVGFTEPTQSPASLVSSYLTFSPLPPRKVEVVCFLWHYPSGYPGWLLAITLPCGARTFLERFRARSPSRQIHTDSSAPGARGAIGWLHADLVAPVGGEERARLRPLSIAGFSVPPRSDTGSAQRRRGAGCTGVGAGSGGYAQGWRTHRPVRQ